MSKQQILQMAQIKGAMQMLEQIITIQTGFIAKLEEQQSRLQSQFDELEEGNQ